MVVGAGAACGEHVHPAIAISALLRGDGHHPASQRFVVNSAT
ncbi:hypothetical protein MYA_5821 [Burkholderia sp. KJ006]|nr:hypothetical protein MYA_5821 [Burkholderia sp. KJ006]